jgi:ABC-type sugar transport system ATPase subunit
MYLGSELARFGLFPKRSAHRAIVQEFLDRLEWSLPLDALPGEISLADQQKVAILRGLLRRPAPRLLLLDEPTTYLTPPERTQVLRELKKVRDAGIGIILVSHRPSDLVVCCDKIAILEHGRIKDTVTVADRSVEDIAAEIFSSIPADRGHKHEPASPSPASVRIVLKLDEIKKTERCGEAYWSLSLDTGGKSGLFVIETPTDSPSEELFNLLAGLNKKAWFTGEATINNLSFRDLSNRQIRSLGIGIVPADKLASGLCRSLSVHENIILTDRTARLIFSRRARGRTRNDAGTFGLEDRLRDPVSHLSGGLQQRTILARELGKASCAMFLLEPSQGLDYESRERLYAALKDRVSSGLVCLILTTDVSEFREMGATETRFIRRPATGS